jgi:predicted  nucleic acid-binding Zn-ribbon protein
MANLVFRGILVMSFHSNITDSLRYQGRVKNAVAGALVALGLVASPVTMAWSQSSGTAEIGGTGSTLPSVETAPPGGLPILNKLGEQMSGLNETIGAMAKQLQEKSELIQTLQAQLENAQKELTAAQSEGKQNAVLIEELQGNLTAASGTLDTAQKDLAESRSVIEDLTAQVEAGKSDAQAVSELKANVDALTQSNQTLEAKAAEAAAALAAAQADQQSGNDRLAQIQAERDALARQRFWLSILVALSLVGVAYFAMRGRQSSSSGPATEAKPKDDEKPNDSEIASDNPMTTAKGAVSKAGPKASASAAKLSKSDSNDKTS